MDLISDLSASEKLANAVGADEIKQKKKMIWTVSCEMKRGIKYIILTQNIRASFLSDAIPDIVLPFLKSVH